MSLLEDIFLQDEADEAQELERVLEGDEYDERQPVSEAEEDNDVVGEDEAEEDKRRVDPTSAKPKRVIKNPRFILNPARLTGPRGIQVIPEHFKDFKFKGKGHEKEDLDLVLKKLEHWAYRLYPKFQFEDCLKKIETLGKKRPVMVHLTKIRTDQFLSDEVVTQKDSSDEENLEQPVEEDEFDKLLQQQIELARATPAPGSVRKGMETPRAEWQNRSPFTMPKATSSPSISDDQKERMLHNRKLAEERRLAKLKQKTDTIVIDSPVRETITEIDEPIAKKHNRSNVIDSSDEECEVTTVNTSINADIHTNLEPKTINSTNDNQDAIETENNGNFNEDTTTSVADEDKMNSQTNRSHKVVENENNGNSNETTTNINEEDEINDVNNKNNEEMEITEADNVSNFDHESNKNGDSDNINTNEDISNDKDDNHTEDDNFSEEITTDRENATVLNTSNPISKSNDGSTKESMKTSTESKDKNLDPSTVDSQNTNVIEDVMDVDFDEDF